MHHWLWGKDAPVCMYVCKHVCLYIYIYVCMYVCRYVCQHAHSICMHVRIITCVTVYACFYISTQEWKHMSLLYHTCRLQVGTDDGCRSRSRILCLLSDKRT